MGYVPAAFADVPRFESRQSGYSQQTSTKSFVGGLEIFGQFNERLIDGQFSGQINGIPFVG